MTDQEKPEEKAKKAPLGLFQETVRASRRKLAEEILQGDKTPVALDQSVRKPSGPGGGLGQ